MDRRSFLQSLMALGASLALPTPIAHATAAEVDSAWELLQTDQVTFCVDSGGMLWSPFEPESVTRGDAFNCSINADMDVDALVLAARDCPRLQDFLSLVAETEQMSLQATGSPTAFARAEELAQRLDADRDGDWAGWIRWSAEVDVNKPITVIDDWAVGEVDCNDREILPPTYGAQGCAFAFFSSMAPEELDALGVVIIEGQHPGSSYYAAELSVSVGEGNKRAAKIGMPISFEAEAR